MTNHYTNKKKKAYVACHTRRGGVFRENFKYNLFRNYPGKSKTTKPINEHTHTQKVHNIGLHWLSDDKFRI